MINLLLTFNEFSYTNHLAASTQSANFRAFLNTLERYAIDAVVLLMSHALQALNLNSRYTRLLTHGFNSKNAINLPKSATR